MKTPLLKALIAIGLLGAAANAALYFYPGLAILPLASGLQMSPYCDLWQTVKGVQVKLDAGLKAKEILASSHLVKTEDDLKLWSTPEGEFWVPDTSDNILSILLAQQDRKIYGDASNGGVRKGDIVLDAGSHIGTYTMTALRAGAEKVIAIDPSPEALAAFRRNFAREIAAGKVVVYPKGLWDEEKQLVLYANGNGAAGDSFLEAGAGARKIADIPVTTIDKLVAELGLPRVDIIKADVKGAGERMLIGGVNTIRKFHPRVIISTEEAPEDPKAIHDRLMSIDSSYMFRCGPCLLSGTEVRTDTVFFQ